MKTVKKNKKFKRASDHDAKHLVVQGWKYCSKSEWKEQVRDAEPVKKKLKKKKGAK
tara:strand:- start:766 stop:933 length:168 start_codon:yes stop_codon:yes gene_type:complete